MKTKTQITINPIADKLHEVTLNGQLIFMIYHDPGDGYIDLSVVDKDNINSIEVFTTNKYKVVRPEGVRIYKKVIIN